MSEARIRFHLRQWLLDPPLAARIAIFLPTILFYGSAGFLYFELPGNPDLGWGDGLWYTVVTMATVGYGDLYPKTPQGRFLVGFPLMFFGVGLLGYLLSTLASLLITARKRELCGMGDFRKNDHLVIVNYAGEEKTLRVLDELLHAHALGKAMPVVLVDEWLEELPASLAARGVRFVRGNPTRDETLLRANIDKAQHAVVLARRPGDAASDSLNIAITLAIEGRLRQVNTVVECVDPASTELLRKAGCDHVVCGGRFEAFFVSQELLNPGIQEVLDELLSCSDGQQMYISDLPVAPPLRWDALERLCRERGHIPMGLRRQGKPLLNPSSMLMVEAGDRLITLGPTPLKWL